jgi:hypothetical protein
MSQKEFEELLTRLTKRLTSEVRQSAANHPPREFENRTRELLTELCGDKRIRVDLKPSAQLFPDIVVGDFGIEVKVVNTASWRTVANSVFEGSRDPNVKHVYVLYGKMGGTRRSAGASTKTVSCTYAHLTCRASRLTWKLKSRFSQSSGSHTKIFAPCD